VVEGSFTAPRSERGVEVTNVKQNDDSPNPRMIVGAPQRGASLEEVKAWAAENGFLGSLLIDIGHYYYGHEAPGDREIERKKSAGRER
jgi:lipoprotein-anchoring transpeptidase ErfK/SrfK